MNGSTMFRWWVCMDLNRYSSLLLVFNRPCFVLYCEPAFSCWYPAGHTILPWNGVFICWYPRGRVLTHVVCKFPTAGILSAVALYRYANQSSAGVKEAVLYRMLWTSPRLLVSKRSCYTSLQNLPYVRAVSKVEAAVVSGGGEGEESNHRLTHRQDSHQNSKLGSCEVRTNMAGSSFVVCFQYITRSYYTSQRNWCSNCYTALKI